MITTRSNPRCRSRGHLRVRVLQHDGIRVGLAPHMLLCLDERGKFTGDHQNTLGLPGRPAPLGRVVVRREGQNASVFCTSRMTGRCLLHTGRSHRCRAPAPWPGEPGSRSRSTTPPGKDPPVSVSEDTLTRQGRPPPQLPKSTTEREGASRFSMHVRQLIYPPAALPHQSADRLQHPQ